MKPLVIKLGGVLLDTKEALNNLFTVISKYRSQYSRPLVIVHGGGCLVDELMEKLSLPIMRHNGLRITPENQIDIIVGALSGSANKILLAEAKKHHLSAIGLSLADGNTVNVTQISPELGFVGEPTSGDATFLNMLLTNKYIPILSSIGITSDGSLMNVNADQAAVAIAKTINADLVILADVKGVLDQNKQRIEILTETIADELIAQGIITGGMIVKVKSAFTAAKMLGTPIDIASWENSAKLIDLFNGQPIGTRVIA